MGEDTPKIKNIHKNFTTQKTHNFESNKEDPNSKTKQQNFNQSSISNDDINKYYEVLEEITKKEYEEKGLNPNIKITNEMKEEFFRCTLEDIPYTRTYEFLNGKLKVTLVTHRVKDSEEVARKMRNFIDATALEFEMAMAKYYLAIQLKEYIINDKTKICFDGLSLEERIQKLETLNTTLFSQLLKAKQKFDDEIKLLQYEIDNDKNF